jgi:hypothetical protein
MNKWNYDHAACYLCLLMYIFYIGMVGDETDVCSGGGLRGVMQSCLMWYCWPLCFVYTCYLWCELLGLGRGVKGGLWLFYQNGLGCI